LPRIPFEIKLYGEFTKTRYVETMFRIALLVFALGLAGSVQAAELSLTLSAGPSRALEDVVVMVRSDAGARGAPRIAGPFRMAQKDTRFQPFVMIVPVGAEVSFPNLDPFHHHVYSFSKAKTFELKLYSRDETRRVTLDKPGIVAIGCNIHDAMTAFIRVVDTPYAAKSGANGIALVRDLPPGPATVTVWHPYLKAPGGELTRRVTIPASGSLTLALNLDVRTSRLRPGG
jgi:plastocyanin